ncbi:DUF882 domain-containing protein [Notoacmeibacter ruber]|nr:DUF882 domain-containing protein [Notoacmeibacter ruber]
MARFGLPVLASLAVFLISPAEADAATQTLKLYNVHTKEKADITFKRNGRYDAGGLKKINHFLRDWRRDEPTKIDPQLLDIVWEAHRQTGSREYIHVISGYRSPKTNAMLRRTRGGQAKKSQHMLGKAMDFYIPGVKLSKLREIGFKLQGGGVGFYPRSGSPFVHFDTGNVRAWPRMSRNELARVFPKGNTLHLPADGKPLPGYQTAMTAYKQRKSKGIAYAGGNASSGSSGGFLAALFGGGNDEAEDEAESAIARAPARASNPVPAAIVRQPEPSPGQLLAALPASSVPLPVTSPRRTGAPVPPGSIPEAGSATVPTVETAPEVPATATDDEVGSLLAAVDVPLPTARPRTAEPAPTVLALASQNTVSNDALEAANAVADTRLPVPLPVTRPQSDASALLAALDATQKVDASPIVPVRAERNPDDSAAALQAVSFASASNSSRNGRLTAEPATELAMNDVPTSRRIRADMVSPAVTGTTGTAARPGKADAAAFEAQRQEALIRLKDVDQARWALKIGSPKIERKEAEATRSLRTPPSKMVITAFTQEPQKVASNAFSGNAINFQTVARFER